MLILGIDSATMTLGMALVSRDEGGVDRVLEASQHVVQAVIPVRVPRKAGEINVKGHGWIVQGKRD